MASLTPQSSIESGNQKIRLTYRVNDQDTRPKFIDIFKFRSLPIFHSGRIPVYYSFDPGSEGRSESHSGSGDDLESPLDSVQVPPRSPAINIIAAPGVSVELVNYPQYWASSLATPGVNVYRVQNPRLVPTIGTPPSFSALVSNYFIDTRPHASLQGAMTRGSGGGDAEESEWARRYVQIFDSRIATEEETRMYMYADRFSDVYTQPLVTQQFDEMRLFRGEDPITYNAEYLSPVSLLEIINQPNGVIFKHPYSSQALFVEVPQSYHRLYTRERQDHVARFAYRINFGSPGRSEDILPLVTIVKTREVKVTLTSTQQGRVISHSDLRERVRRSLVFFGVYETTFDMVPPQGFPLPSSVTSQGQTTIDFAPDPFFALGQIFIDIGIGMIPYIGEAADITEFSYALSTNIDRWGRRVSTLEKVIMGVGVLLPLVGTAAILSATRLRRIFGESRHTAQRMGEAIGQANFTPEESRLLNHLSDELKAGRRPAFELLQQAMEIIKKLPSCNA